MTLKSWALGLLNAVISGTAVGLSTGFVDTSDFNLSTHAGLVRLGTVAGTSAFVSLVKYVIQFHIPGIPPNQGV